jgi:aminomethyltransferase
MRALPAASAASASGAVSSLKPFNAIADDGPGELDDRRTGYTGEDGFEVVLPVSEAAGFGPACAKPASRPADSAPATRLRLEAG